MELSIIVISLNEEKNLPKLLSSIRKQNYKNYELILSDAGSIDKTRQIARRFNCKIVEGGLPAKGRNNGARTAKGKYLLFLDADTILPSGFLEKAVKQMENNDIDFAAVKIKPLARKKIENFFFSVYNIWQKLMSRVDPHAAGSCIVIKKSFFKKIKGFDETILLAEDHALARKAYKLGAKFRILDAYVLVSTRRMRKEGKVKIVAKYILAVFHRIFIGEIRNNFFRYNLKR